MANGVGSRANMNFTKFVMILTILGLHLLLAWNSLQILYIINYFNKLFYILFEESL